MPIVITIKRRENDLQTVTDKSKKKSFRKKCTVQETLFFSIFYKKNILHCFNYKNNL